MEEIDIETAKRLKNRMWTPGLKEFYEPEDVIRYFDEVDRLNINRLSGVIPPQKFFTEEVLKEGLALLRIRNIKRANRDGWQHFLKGDIITSEFSEDVIYSLKTEKLTREEIQKRYGISFDENNKIVR